MTTVLQSFIQLLTSGITDLAEGIGAGLKSAVEEMFLTLGTDGTVTGLSTFGGVVAVFAGIGLAIGLTTKIFEWIRSIGN